MKTIKIGSILGITLWVANVAMADVSICYQQECRPMIDYTQQQIMTQLKDIFVGDKHVLLFCQSDPNTRTYSEQPISFSGHSRLVDVNFQIPFARVSQIKQKGKSIEMALDYQIKANQFYPFCEAPQSSLSLIETWRGGLQLSSSTFMCRLTDLGTTQVKFQFDIDYIDLNQELFGGNYKVNIYGQIVAESSGYALFRLTNDRVIKTPRSVLGKVPTEEQIMNPNIDESNLYFEGKDPLIIKNDASEPTNWGEKWDNFKEKFLKILYLEPLDD